MGQTIIRLILLASLFGCARVVEPPTHCVRYWIEKQGEMVVVDELRSPDAHCKSMGVGSEIKSSPTITGFLGDTFRLITSLIPI